MYEFLEYRVDDVMTKDPITVRPSTPLREVELLFERYDFNGAPVLDAEEKLVGVMTKLDFLKAFRFTDESLFPAYEDILERTVATVMTPDVQTVTPREHLTRVLEKLVDSGRKSFPVVDWGRLIGVVAREDIIDGLRRAAGIKARP